MNPTKPYVKTSERVTKYAKGDYKNISMEGRIPNNFLFAVLRGTEIVPFAHLPYLVAVLPLLKEETKYKVLNRANIKRRGYSNLLDWINKVQKIWEEKKGDNVEHTAIEWINYRNKIERQNPSSRFKVLYNTSGTHIVASLVDLEKEDLIEQVNGALIPLQGFVADIKTFYYETNNKKEAYYLNMLLTTMLNSFYVDDLIKGMQSRGLFGPRDIHKKVLELPIPKFDPDIEKHRKLVEFGEKCRKKAYEILPQWRKEYKSTAWIRKGLKGETTKEIDDLSEELAEIAEITKEILS